MDVIHAIVLYLRASSTIQALPVAQIDDIELDVNEDLLMPAKVIVVKPHGGPGDPGPLQVNYTTILLQCFGETPHLSYVVEETAFLALKALTPSVWSNTYIHNVIRTSGPIPGRLDQNDQWPFHSARFRVMASDLTIP